MMRTGHGPPAVRPQSWDQPGDRPHRREHDAVAGQVAPSPSPVIAGCRRAAASVGTAGDAPGGILSLTRSREFRHPEPARRRAVELPQARDQTLSAGRLLPCKEKQKSVTWRRKRLSWRLPGLNGTLAARSRAPPDLNRRSLTTAHGRARRPDGAPVRTGPIVARNTRA